MERTPGQEYYSGLSGFLTLFETGTPALMYHKVATQPRRALSKALYVNQDLFRRQMRELREAGFSSIPIGEVCENPDNRRKRLTITFDDGYQNVLENAAGPLAENGFQAIQFLVAGQLGGENEWDRRLGEAPEKLMDKVEIREWLAAGHEIGAHTMTHPHLSTLPVEVAREEITASKKRLEDSFSAPVVHFCYPYGDCNKRIRDLVEEAGYQTACTTDFGVNTSATPRFEIKRLLARRASRRPQELLARLRDKLFNIRL